MQETRRILRPQKTGTVPAGNLAMGQRQFASALPESPENAPRFVTCLMAGAEEDTNIGLYQIAMLLIRRWAGEQDLDGADASVIEESRKICDVMGWMPTMK